MLKREQAWRRQGEAQNLTEGEVAEEEKDQKKVRLEGDPDYSLKFQGEEVVVVAAAVKTRGPAVRFRGRGPGVRRAQGLAATTVAQEQCSRQYYPHYQCWNHSLQVHHQQQ